jgi:hypothetical protein
MVTRGAGTGKRQGAGTRTGTSMMETTWKQVGEGGDESEANQSYLKSRQTLTYVLYSVYILALIILIDATSVCLGLYGEHGTASIWTTH